MKKMNIWDSIVFAIVLRICACIVGFVRVGRPLVCGICMVVTVLLYVYLRKGNRHPYHFIAAMAITHCVVMALLVIVDRFCMPYFNLWPYLEKSLVGYMGIILLGDIVITKMINSKKPSA